MASSDWRTRYLSASRLTADWCRIAVRAMPEFMTNLRAACLKLRGGVGNSGLLNPDLFRYGRLFLHFYTCILCSIEVVLL